MNDQMPTTPTVAVDVAQEAPAPQPAPAAPLAAPTPSYPAPVPPVYGSSQVYGGTHAYGRPVSAQAPPAPLPSKPALARWLVGLAAAGIAGRLLTVAACANRISFADNFLSGGTGTLDDANQADRFVTISSVVSAVAFLSFLGVLIAVRKRGKRGDALCAAVANNSAVRMTSRVYLIAVVASVFLRNAFQRNDFASPQDQIHSVIHGDWASIALNVFVVAFLVAIVKVTRRELAKAQTAAPAA
ncbi:hypothetical protein ABH926_009467 [Catenulispora sp. GP43]|uniref:hypothetical protein n=1 Tax=Catenulispora sp. GP43 TaxID=3156263 RepID=UPI003517F801